MKKYLTFFKSYLANSLEYRSTMLTWFVVELISLATGLFLWVAVFRTNSRVGDYNFDQIMSYYILIPLVGFFTSIYVSNYLPSNIKYGKISLELLKPYSLSASVLINSTATQVTNLFLRVPVYLVVMIILFAVFGVSLSIGPLVVGLFVCVFAYLLHFLIDLCISYCAFWMDDVWALSHFKFIGLAIFGGLSFTLDLVPERFRLIFDYNPLKFIYFFPVTVISGKFDLAGLPAQLGLLFIWMLFFALLSKFLWHLGIKKYAAYGN